MVELSEIPTVRFGTDGVMFNYLVLELEWEGKKKGLVRGLNFTPYAGSPDDQVLRWVEGELKAAGIDESSRRLEVKGGGSISRNPYDETVTLFGASRRFGAEPDRKAVAKLLEAAFEGHEISWYDVESTSSSPVRGSR